MLVLFTVSTMFQNRHQFCCSTVFQYQVLAIVGSTFPVHELVSRSTWSLCRIQSCYSTITPTNHSHVRAGGLYCPLLAVIHDMDGSWTTVQKCPFPGQDQDNLGQQVELCCLIFFSNPSNVSFKPFPYGMLQIFQKHTTQTELSFGDLNNFTEELLTYWL